MNNANKKYTFNSIKKFLPTLASVFVFNNDLYQYLPKTLNYSKSGTPQVCKIGQTGMKYLVFAFPTSIWHPLRLVYYPCGVGNPYKSPAKVPEFPDMARSPVEMNGTRGARENT